ncbi:MAG TPA: ABC transporter permease, partial [Devosia sp.]|nr:ABC transporter permease [Devosia sp.]
MLRFLTMRILSAIPLLLLLSVVTFAIIQAPPGDYGDYIRSMLMYQGGVPAAQAEIQADAYRVANGLNEPMVIQYFHWIWGIVTRFDFGHSLYYNKPVGTVVLERLPATIALALTCHILASVIGISLGILAATKQYSWVDTTLGIISFLGMTIPRFLLAIVILYFLVFRLNVSEVGMFFSARYG